MWIFEALSGGCSGGGTLSVGAGVRKFFSYRGTLRVGERIEKGDFQSVVSYGISVGFCVSFFL